MGKRKRKKSASKITRRVAKNFFGGCYWGLVKAIPFLSLATIGAGIFWGIRSELYADPGFRIKTVVVTPQGILSPAKAADLERRYLNQSLFILSLEGVVKKVEEDPNVEEVRVLREFPSTLKITLVPRSPFGQIQFGNKGPFYWVAEDGTVLGEDSSRNKDYILIQAWEANGITTEKGKKISLPGLQEGTAFARAFSKHALARTEKIEAIHLDHLGNVSLVLKEGPEMRFGRNPLKKIQTLDLLTPFLKGEERARIIYLDLQFKDVIVKKK